MKPSALKAPKPFDVEPIQKPFTPQPQGKRNWREGLPAKPKPLKAESLPATSAVPKKKEEKNPAPTMPKLPSPPKYDPAKIVFTEEAPWLQKILQETWNKLPPNWQADIGRYPYEALKAWLFYYNQGANGVLYKDQFIPGHLAAQDIQKDVENQFYNLNRYRQEATQNYQNQVQQYKQIQEERRSLPLPFRVAPRFL